MTTIDHVIDARGTRLNITDIQTILSDTIRDLVADKTAPAKSNAIANVTGKILTSVGLQMKYAQLTGQTPNIDIVDMAPHKSLKQG